MESHYCPPQKKSKLGEPQKNSIPEKFTKVTPHTRVKKSQDEGKGKALKREEAFHSLSPPLPCFKVRKTLKRYNYQLGLDDVITMLGSKSDQETLYYLRTT